MHVINIIVVSSVFFLRIFNEYRLTLSLKIIIITEPTDSIISTHIKHHEKVDFQLPKFVYFPNRKLDGEKKKRF